MTDEQMQAIERVRKYLAERAKSRQLHQEEIHGLNAGDETREAMLLASDLQALLDAASAAPAQEPNCRCHKCATPEYRMSHMILCPTCGNKRCPHASDHALACTNSNESGQLGSVY